MSQAYPIHRSLWESLDAILYTKGVALAKEVAAELNVSSKDILGSMRIEELGKFTIIPDESQEVYQCEAITQQGDVYMRCRYPVLDTAPRRCAKHLCQSMEIPRLPFMKRLVTPEETYVYDPKTLEVFNLNGTQCGTLKGSKLLLFDIKA